MTLDPLIIIEKTLLNLRGFYSTSNLMYLRQHPGLAYHSLSQDGLEIFELKYEPITQFGGVKEYCLTYINSNAGLHMCFYRSCSFLSGYYLNYLLEREE